MPNENHNVLYRDLRMDGSIDDTNRTVDISFSSEAPVKRYDWSRGSYYDEILGHNAGNVDLSRLENLGVALYNHNRDQVIGAIIEPVLDTTEHRCKAKIRFDTDDFSEMIYQKVKSGTLKGISVGYSIDNMEVVADGKKSADGVPADIDVGIGRSFDGVDIDPGELEEFRKYQAAKKEQQQRQQKQNGLDTLKRELEILEMEC